MTIRRNFDARLLALSITVVFYGSMNDRIYVRGQSSDQPTTSSANSRPVNLFIINEETNEIANKSVTNSLKTTRMENPDWVGKIVIVTINGTDPNDDLNRICGAWDTALQETSSEIPDMVLDTTRTGPGAETVNLFTRSLGIPTLSGQFGQEGDLRHWRDLSDDQKMLLVQVMPPADIIPEAVRQLALQVNISNLAIIFDEDFVMDHKYKSLLLNVPTRHVIVRMKPTESEKRAQLQRLRELDIVNYFILGGEELLTSTLDIAQTLNYTGQKYGWYALTQDNFKADCECKNVSLIFFQPKIMSDSQQRLAELTNRGLLAKPILASAFYYDLTRLAVVAMKSSLNDSLWPKEPKQMTCDAYNGNNTLVRSFDFLGVLRRITSEKQVLPTFADIAWGKKNGEHRAKFDMTVSLTSIANGNAISDETLGTWPANIDAPWQMTNESTIRNHTAVTSYRIVTVAKPPFMIYDAEKDEWSGYCIDLINDIQRRLNFTYEIRIAPDGKFGSMDQDGNWNGMIRELKDKKADIALGALSVMAERENVVDFTVPYYDLVGISILIRRPKSPTSLFKFLTVLENRVWLCILASYFFTSILMWLFDRWSPYSYQNNREKYRDDEEKREFTLKECLWFCMTSLTPQGGGEAPKNISGRLVAATWWLFGFIIIASYTANLAAFLTVSRLETPVESLEDLSKQYKIQYAPIKDSEAYVYFDRMSQIESRFYEIWKDMSLNDSLTDIERAKLAVWDYPVSDKYTKMFHAMKEARFPADLDEALQRVRFTDNHTANEFALIGDATDIKYLALTDCSLLAIGDEFSRKPYAIAVQQGSPLKDQLNNAILQLLNERQLEKLKNKWWTHNPKRVTCEKEENESDGISIENIGGVFIVIFVGIGLACLTLVFEYWWYRHRPRQQSKLNGDSKIPERTLKPLRLTLKPAKTPAFEPKTIHFRPRF